MILPNLAASGGYVAALILSRRAPSPGDDLGLVHLSRFNLSFAGIFFGLTGGIWLYLVLLPALGVLLVRIDDRVGRTVIMVGGSTMFGVVGSIAGDGPDLIAGTRFESTMFVLAAWTTALTASMVSWYYRRFASFGRVPTQVEFVWHGEIAIEKTVSQEGLGLLTLVPAGTAGPIAQPPEIGTSYSSGAVRVSKLLETIEEAVSDDALL